MKNVLLVDNELKVIESILNNTDWMISVLITVDGTEYMNNKRIMKVISYDYFRESNDLTGFEYKDLENLWKAQLKVQNCYNRFSTDFQMGKFYYYKGCAIVKRIFSNNDIDLVIIKGLNHGYTWDRLIMEYAKNQNISCYNIETMLYGTRFVYDNLREKPLTVKNSQVNLNDTIFYKEELNPKNGFGSNVWGKIYNIVYKVFGALGVDIIKCLRYRDVGLDKWNVNTIERVKYYRAVRKMQKKYIKLSHKLDEYKETNYIYYPLHLEPEASVDGRCNMDSQLIAIQMLSNHLPKGWKLLVKEHPLQYRIETYEYYSYLLGTYRYKSELFYETISKMENVFLIDLKAESKELIKRSKAVATLNGTVASEAVELGKNALIFGGERTIYRYVNGYYCISSDKDCIDAIKAIEESPIPSYDNYEEVCKKYLIDFSDEKKGYEIAVKTIQNELNKMEI